MISIDLCEGLVTRSDLPTAQMGTLLQRVQEGQFLWVDVCAPTEQDWQVLETRFTFHPLALEDARKQTQRPKVDLYEHFLYVSVHAWRGDASPTAGWEALTTELDFFVGPGYLVTIHD